MFVARFGRDWTRREWRGEEGVCFVCYFVGEGYGEAAVTLVPMLGDPRFFACGVRVRRFFGFERGVKWIGVVCGDDEG